MAFKKLKSGRLKTEVTPLVSSDVDIHEKWLDGAEIYDLSTSSGFQSFDSSTLDRQTLKSLFYSEDWVFITVDAIAQPLSRVPWLVYRKVMSNGKLTYEPDEGHALNNLLENPSPLIDSSTLKYMIFSEDSLMGNAIIWHAKQMNQLHVIPAEICDYEWNYNTNQPIRLRVSNQNQEGMNIVPTIPVEDIVHIMRPHASNKYWGLSPFIPTQRSVKFNTYTTEFLNAFYQRGATPQGMLELEKDANEQKAIQLLKKFEAAYAGRKNTRRTMILPKGVRYTGIESKIADQQLVELINMNRETILNALHIPKHVVSLQEAGSLGSNEFKTSLKYFWQSTLIPITERVAGKLTSFFKKELGPDRVIGFNFDGIEVLQEDQMQKALLAKELLSIMTLNEVRESVFDLPGVEGGDTVATPQAQPTPSFPFSFQSLSPKETAEENEKETVTKEIDPQNPMVKPEITENDSKPEPVIETELDKRLKKYQSKIKAVDGLVRAEEKVTVNKFALAAQKMLNLQADIAQKALIKSLRKKAKFNEKEYNKMYDEMMSEFYDTAGVQYADDVQASMNLGYQSQLAMVTNGQDKDMIYALRKENEKGRRQILEDRGLEIFKSTGRTTSEETIKKTVQVLDAIAKAKEENATIPEITQEIRQYLDERGQSRAKTIARTEVLTAVSLGQRAMHEDASEVIDGLQKMWINAGDQRVRGNKAGPSGDSPFDHWDVHGETVPFDDKFSNGLQFPRDPKGQAGNIINCRCNLILITPEDRDQITAPDREDIPDASSRE